MKTATRIAAIALLSGATLAAVGCSSPNALLRRQGMEALDANNVGAAEAKFAQALKNDPTDWKSQYYLGLIRIRQNRHLDAQLALEKALTLRPDHAETPDILDALAESIYQQNQPAQLAAMLKKACDDFGTTRDYLRQAKYLGRIADVDGSRLAFRKAAKMSPKNDPQIYLAIAEFHESVGDTDSAIEALRKAYYLAPRHVRVQERLRHYGIVPGPTVALKPGDDELSGGAEAPPVFYPGPDRRRVD